jgi:hypothetical protein
MAERPANTRTVNVVNPGLDKRIPLGFVDVVIDKSSNEWVGFLKDGKFYKLGEKVTKSSKPTQSSGPLSNADVKASEREFLNFKDANKGKKSIYENTIKTAESDLIKAEKENNLEKYNRILSNLQNAQKALDDLNKRERELEELFSVQKELFLTDKAIQFQQGTKGTVDATLQTRKTELETKRQELTGVKPTPSAPASQAPQVVGQIPSTSGPQQGQIEDAQLPPDQKKKKKDSGKKIVIPPSSTQTPPPPPEKGGKKDKKVKGEEDFQAVFAEAESLYGAIDDVFKNDKELMALLTKAVGVLDDPDDNFSVDRFTSELSNTRWFKENAGPIRQRQFFKNQYEALKQQIKTDDPNYQTRLEGLDRTSEYGRGLESTIQQVKEEARSIGRQIDDTTARFIATNLYDYANENDAVKIRNAVLGAGRFTVGGITTGEAGINKQTLLAVARANGLDLTKNFGEATIDTWLDRIAKGESIETIKNLIRQTAKTTWQVDDRVAALLDQGVDLQTVYSPFRKQMATTLEIPEDEITIDELSKRGLFGGQKPMNLYDFKRSLRQDDRWQYTEGARTEMAALTENLLRDFGFVG